VRFPCRAAAYNRESSPWTAHVKAFLSILYHTFK
jgi:hypothetical protein